MLYKVFEEINQSNVPMSRWSYKLFNPANINNIKNQLYQLLLFSISPHFNFKFLKDFTKRMKFFQ